MATYRQTNIWTESPCFITNFDKVGSIKKWEYTSSNKILISTSYIFVINKRNLEIEKCISCLLWSATDYECNLLLIIDILTSVLMPMASSIVLTKKI